MIMLRQLIPYAISSGYLVISNKSYSDDSTDKSSKTLPTVSNEQRSMDIIKRFHTLYMNSNNNDNNYTNRNKNDDNNNTNTKTNLTANNNSNVISNDNNTNQNNTKHKPITNIRNRKIEIVGKSSDQRIPGIQLLVNDTLAITALEGIKDSHDLAQSIAKQLVVQVLTTPIYKNQFADILKYIFSYESILSPTRWLVYWALDGRDCLSNALYQSKWQLNYLMNDQEPIGAKNYSVGQINHGLDSWLRNSMTRKDILIPNISLYLNENIDVITKEMVKSIPKTQDKTIEGLSTIIVESLKSEVVRSAARDGLVYYFKLTSGKEIKQDKDKEKSKEKDHN